MNSASMMNLGRSHESRRRLYRRSKRVLLVLLAGRWPGRRPALERVVRGLLRDRPRNYLVRVAADRGFALAAVAALVASATATAVPPVELADVAAGTGGFVINGIDPGDGSGVSVSGAGDVNGDGLADLIVGATHANPGGNIFAGQSYVVFGPSCPWDCADGDGQVGVVDFLALLQGWGAAGFCDFNGGGIGVVDFLALLQHWGPCP